MEILAWVVLGLIAGAIAKWIMPGNDPGGWIITILLGIAGAVVGGFLAGLIGLGPDTTDGDVFNLWSLVLAILGALLLLFLYRQFVARRHV